MANSEELQNVFEKKIKVDEFLRRVEENPDRVKDILQKLKEENREPLIEAATAFFTEKGEINLKTKELIEKEVDAYLEEIASRAREQVEQEDWRERAKKRLLSFIVFVRVHKSTFIFVAILTVFIVGTAFIIGFGQNTNVSKPNSQAKAVISLAQGQITVRQKGIREATITVAAPLAASEILLYENSKVIGRWDRGGILKKTVFHQEGTYIYFAEIFLGSEKSITDQKSVTYGGEGK